MNDYTEALRLFLLKVPTHDWMLNTRWAWPTCESIHFLGLCLLLGTVGMFDLRLMGVGRQIAPAQLHRLVKYGVLGFFLNIATGICFLSGAPDQYIYNKAFRWKALFVLIAGLNIAVFYTRYFRRVRALGAGDAIPTGARIVGVVSFCMWIGVIAAGRLITFYRPFFHDGIWDF
jgi:hypothetical protein